MSKGQGANRDPISGEVARAVAGCYEDLLELITHEASAESRRTGLLRVFSHGLELGLRDSPFAFGGNAARFDFLSRRHGIRAGHPALDRRLRGLAQGSVPGAPPTAEDPDAALALDLRAVSLFLEQCFGIKPPRELQSRLGTGEFPPSYGQPPEQECIRVSVQSVTPEAILAVSSRGESIRIPLRFSLFSEGDRDYSALATHLWPSAQLNLIHPRRDPSGDLLPEHLILEPDHLINITEVAQAFQPHCQDARIVLLQRLTPRRESLALHLGRLSGMLLDAILNTPQATYPELARRFFEENALQMAALPDYDDPENRRAFHRDAQAQMEHLRKLMGGVKDKFSPWDQAQIVIEPSFLSEHLGLQGRMDLMHMDENLIIEHKSGKWIEHDLQGDGTGRHRIPHLVQVLLYRAMLSYSEMGVQDEHIRTYLLYSRYPNGLKLESQSPGLLHKALNLRNEIILQHRLLAEGRGLDLLLNLRPEDLLQRRISPKFWTAYLRPGIESVLNPIQRASASEQAYFNHLLTFILREQHLAQDGASGTGHASMWAMATAQRREGGLLLDNLSIRGLEEGPLGVAEIHLEVQPEDETPLPNMRLGELALLYSYPLGQEPDVRRGMIHRGTISAQGPRGVSLRLNAPQRNASLFNGEVRWAVEHDYNETMTHSQLRALMAFLTAPEHRRRLILNERPPRSQDYILRGEYGKLNEMVQRAMSARDFFILVGPPGTGKTSQGLVNILREALLTPGTNILLAAFTNRAVEEICNQLETLPQGQAVRYIRMGQRGNPNSLRWGKNLHQIAKEVGNRPAFLEILKNTRIFVGTVSSLGNRPELFQLKRFDLAIIDEASQLLEPVLLPLLTATNPTGEVAIERFVLIGDHKQLPAIVLQPEGRTEFSDAHLSQIADPSTGLVDFRLSLFERLLRQLPADSRLRYTFEHQGRMHPEIANFPAQQFYAGRLDHIARPHQVEALDFPTDAHGPIRQAIARARVVFFDVQNHEATPTVKVNGSEARLIGILADEVLALYRRTGRAFDPSRTLGIIVPYRHQTTRIQRELEHLGHAELTGVTIDTVERFQGSQRDVIIYGFTAQRTYQLEFLLASRFTDHLTGAQIDRKLNVALTRARKQLFIVGNRHLLEGDPIYRALISRCQLRITCTDSMLETECNKST